MINNFIPGSESEFSFEVNITGTSKVPSIVRVYLEYDGKIDCYNCEKEDNKYSTILTVPNTDLMKLYIELVINGKHIRPYSDIISFKDISTPEVVEPEVIEPVEVPVKVESKKEDSSTSPKNYDIISKIVDSMEENPKAVKKVVKEEKIKFVKPQLIKKEKKPLTVDFLDLVEKTKEVKPIEPIKEEIKIVNTKINKIPFKLIKEEIIEK
jgi:hypothetical protein